MAGGHRSRQGKDMEFFRHTEWPMWFGYAAVASSVITCAMKTMIPLRVVSMTCNALFIVYGFFGGIYPTLVLNLILLPLNTVRLQQMRKLIQDVEAAAERAFKSSIGVWGRVYEPYVFLKSLPFLLREGYLAYVPRWKEYMNFHLPHKVKINIEGRTQAKGRADR